MDINKQYKTILESIQDEKDYMNKDIFNELINTEQNVLKSINRIIEHEQEKKINKSLMANTGLYDFVTLFANTWYNIFHEIFIDKQYRSSIDIFTKGDRKIFVGTMFLIIALLMLMTLLS